jgi:hypothetical protein
MWFNPTTTLGYGTRQVAQSVSHLFISFSPKQPTPYYIRIFTIRDKIIINCAIKNNNFKI